MPPTGIVSFLLTDIEGSTRLWEEFPEQMTVALARHDDIVRSAIAQHGGYVFSTAGDGFNAAFSTCQQALAAGIDAQDALASEVWPEPICVRVRMGIHSGQAEARDGSAGRIDDILVDDADWSVRQLVIDTRKWLPGGQVAVQADAVTDIDWSASAVRLDLDRQSIKRSPASH